MSVKTAMMLSLGFIGAVLWVLDRTETPIHRLASPLEPRIARAAAPEAENTPGDEPGFVAVDDDLPLDDVWAAPAVALAGNGTLRDRFAHPSPIESGRAAPAARGAAAPGGSAPPAPVVSPPPVRLPPRVAYEGSPPIAGDGAGEVQTPPRAADAGRADERANPPLAASNEDDQPLVARRPRGSRDPVNAAPASPQIDEKQLATEPAGPDAAGAPRRYRVQKGDSLSRIAARQLKRTDAAAVAQLLAANPAVKKRNGVIRIGEELVLPLPGAAVAADVPPKAAPRAEVAKESAKPRPSADAKQASRRAPTAEKAPPAPKNSKTPRTKRGREDNGTPALADRRTARGASASGKPRSTGSSGPRMRSEVAVVPRTVTVRKGESLTSVARKHLNSGNRWVEIAKLNGLSKPDQIRPGMKLRLPASVEVAAR